jgi:hypothetical protein
VVVPLVLVVVALSQDLVAAMEVHRGNFDLAVVHIQSLATPAIVINN